MTEVIFPDPDAPYEEQRRGYLRFWRSYGPGGEGHGVVSGEAIGATAAEWLLAHDGFSRESDRRKAQAFLDAVAKQPRGW